MRVEVRREEVEAKEWGLPCRCVVRSEVKARRREVEGRVVPEWSR